jgi:hypothetical protein
MLFADVKQGKAADAPWEKADGRALHIAATEGVFTLQVIADIANKLPDEPDENGQLPEFGTWSDTKRQIRLGLFFPQDKKALAALLIYCWQSCLDPKAPTIKDALVELSRVAHEKGWVTLTDVIKGAHKVNKGGRRKGSRDTKTTIPILNCFKRLKAEHPEWSAEKLLDGVVSATRRRGRTRAAHRINVKKTLQREKLYPTKSLKTRKST